jgi:hypothetical protein
MFKTSGNTVLWGLIFLGLFLLFELKQEGEKTSLVSKNNIVSKGRSKVYIEIIALSSIYFAWQLYTFVDFETFRFIEANADLHSLATNINMMNSSGIERFTAFDLPENVETSLNPYHYFEYWFNFYKIENDKRVQMLAMLDEVFAVFEDSTKEEIQGQWKVLRKPKSNEFRNE